MCVASAVTDYYRDKWFTTLPLIPPQPVSITPDMFVLKPGITITPEQWEDYQNLKRIAEGYDTDTDQPECIKPDVAVWEGIVKTLVVQ